MRSLSVSLRVTTRFARNQPTLVTVALVFAILIVTRGASQQAAPNQPPQYIERSYPAPAGNDWPDKNSQMRMHQKSVTHRKFEAANIARKRQIDDDSAELVQIAKELNDAVGRTDGIAFRADIIVKAELIEKLAHAVKEKMTLTVNAN
ncbi:MAG TPA: hypothetical protein VN753_01320 [Terracidiphilus sp.]|nr:hypothetical protein [Terracidiphilus sp.]